MFYCYFFGFLVGEAPVVSIMKWSFCFNARYYHTTGHTALLTSHQARQKPPWPDTHEYYPY